MRAILATEKCVMKGSAMSSHTVLAFMRGTGKSAESFSKLAAIALEEMRTMTNGAEIVCGPLSTGGWGDRDVNMILFNHAIIALKIAGRPIWSQIPYELGCIELSEKWRKETGDTGYCTPILEEFYKPLFAQRPRIIKRAWFLDGDHGWRTSKGARWEHEQMEARGIEIQYFPHSWHRSIPDLSHLR